jgi:hypothetical protein
MGDAETTLLALRERVAQFVRERDWEQFHSPKDLAVGLAIEAAEFLELFLWKEPAEVEAMAQQPEERARMAEDPPHVVTAEPGPGRRRERQRDYLTGGWVTLFALMRVLAEHYGADNVRLSVWIDE